MIVGNNDMIEQDLLILSSIKFAYQAKESHVGKDIGHGTTYSAVLRTTPKHTCHDASHQANKDISQDSITRRDFVPYPDQKGQAG
jgi:hypothetical protein